jgi:hypothetical protein
VLNLFGIESKLDADCESFCELVQMGKDAVLGTSGWCVPEENVSRGDIILITCLVWRHVRVRTLLWGISPVETFPDEVPSTVCVPRNFPRPCRSQGIMLGFSQASACIFRNRSLQGPN